MKQPVPKPTQVKSVEKTISKSADTGSKKFDEMGNQISGRLSSNFLLSDLS